MIIRCVTCSHAHSLGPCQGNPHEATCFCQQCHTQTVMTMARAAVDGNSIQAMRAALRGTLALLLQIQTARMRKAYKAPAILPCATCGKPVQVRRRPRPGTPVYCRVVITPDGGIRPTSLCRWKAWRNRQRARDQRARAEVRDQAGQRDQATPLTPTPAHVPVSLPEQARGQGQPAPGVPLWLSVRTAHQRA